jgi:hypothetical protein
VRVPDADSLDPQGNDTTLTARVQVNGASLDDDSYDVVRKGFFDTPGGDYKMEIKRTADPTVGKLHCFFRGDLASVYKVANLDIVDGNWHTLQCAKTATSVVARVDGRSFTTGGIGRLDRQRERSDGGSQEGGPVRRHVRRLDGLREHRHRPTRRRTIVGARRAYPASSGSTERVSHSYSPKC